MPASHRAARSTHHAHCISIPPSPPPLPLHTCPSEYRLKQQNGKENQKPRLRWPRYVHLNHTMRAACLEHRARCVYLCCPFCNPPPPPSSSTRTIRILRWCMLQQKKKTSKECVCVLFFFGCCFFFNVICFCSCKPTRAPCLAVCRRCALRCVRTANRFDRHLVSSASPTAGRGKETAAAGGSGTERSIATV